MNYNDGYNMGNRGGQMSSSQGGMGGSNQYYSSYSNMEVQNMNRIQPQQPTQPQYLPGRMIQSENDIYPGEVPMNGDFGTFIQNDLSTIYLKTWGRNGAIQTNVYTLVNPDQNNNGQNDPLTAIMDRLTGIESSLEEMKNNTNTKNSGGKKNEQSANDTDRNANAK